MIPKKKDEPSFNVLFACMKAFTKRSYLHLINHEYTWAREEQRSSDMNFGIQPLMGRCLYEAEILCLHNDTYSTMFTEMNIAPCFQIISVAMGIKAFCTLQ